MRPHQPAFSVSLAASYPVQLTGQIVMTFTADGSVGIDDPTVQFASGGRTVNFTIPAGSTTGVFSTAPDGTSDRHGGGHDHAESFPAIGQRRGDGYGDARASRAGHAAGGEHAAGSAHGGGIRAAHYGLLDTASTHASRSPTHALRRGATCKPRN